MDRADCSQLPQLRSVLVRSLAADPLMRWFFPEGGEPEEQRLNRIAMYLGPQIEWLVGSGTAYAAVVEDEVIGAAVWMAPGTALPVTLPALRRLAEVLMPAGKAEAVHEGMRAARAGAPEVKGTYLSLTGVEPAWQGRGVGVRLLEPMLGPGAGVRWLESTNPRNVRFYERAGFRVVHQSPVGGSGVTMCRMVGEF
ncbi:GNAT family N-acetyltransferase [Actinomyces bowdenii]|uniref:GNAT family N-acetyltransferase n=1 Tax=Actinomyces bowdenii TaxID=131109 RepID=A0A853EJ51_9ACTO|nr:GNAT family N-acetyltransferase [Actinomyces bowdenii]MBF0697220.1 GNAT family N-acetyltransferase [Actinomyces bowdenii]NYS69393.1 GNAT family N-acetyltransferase [Actinomyces bowdenii]